MSTLCVIISIESEAAAGGAAGGYAPSVQNLLPPVAAPINRRVHSFVATDGEVGPCQGRNFDLKSGGTNSE